MFKQMIDQLILNYRLVKALRLKKKVARVEEALALKTRFPAHGRYNVGGVEVLRFDASGGYDSARFFKDHPDLKAKLQTPAYARPRIERVKYEFAD